LADPEGDPQPQPRRLSPTAVDASLLVAALLTWHESHATAFASLSGLLAGGTEIVLPAPALVEAYAIMTRLPATHRLSPADAFAVLDGSLHGGCRLVDLPAARSWSVLEALAERGEMGDAAADAVIVECAHLGGAERLLTLRPEAFHPRSPIAVLSP